MAAIAAEIGGQWFLSFGLIGSFVVLLIFSIFLTTLCSDCARTSFELQDVEVDKNPPTLVRVVKLEEVARENPMITEIQKDEKEFISTENTFTPWRSHLEVTQHQDVLTNGNTTVMKTEIDTKTAAESDPDVTAVSFPSWRSHLGAPNNSDQINSYCIPQTTEATPPTANHKPNGYLNTQSEPSDVVYAEIKKKAPPVEEREEPLPPPLDQL